MQPKFFKGPQDRMKILRIVLNDLGRPDEVFKLIHIIGTNGKGSTARMTASLLESLGYSVGLFTSPHIDTVYERIQVNGKNISESDYTICREYVRQSVESATSIDFEEMTWFDAFFLTAMVYFAKKEVDLVVMEAGIGGVIDSTNGVNDVDYTLFTKIGMDHHALLGETISEIADVKLGAMRENSTVILAPNQRKVVADQFLEYAKRRHAKPLYAEKLMLEKKDGHMATRLQGRDLKFDTHLLADYQVENMKTTLTFFEDFCTKNGLVITEDLLNRALGQLIIAGRFEIINRHPLIILDGAHNADGISAFTKYVSEHFKDSKKYIVTGFVDDKDIETILPELLSLDGHFFFTTPQTDRGISSQKLEALAERIGTRQTEITEDPLKTILDLAEKERDEKTVIFVVGSLYLITDLRKNL